MRIAGLCVWLSSMALTPAASSDTSASKYSKAEDVIQFLNLGFDGSYKLVSSLNDVESEDCSCELSTTPTYFNGSNSPINEEVSVHVRGPIELLEFGYYVASDFNTTSQNSDSTWERKAYYSASNGTADNVTFTNNKGEDSPCLSNALTYAASNGVNSSSNSTVLDQTTIPSNEEVAIFSTVECESSSTDGDCGVYRPNIPAYHGFYGTTKMFLFSFKAPNDSSADVNTTYPNLPAIWLLNAHIPRTSEYPANYNCSCWDSGCGEFDIFEVMNTTDMYKFTSTLHTYQNTSDVQDGTQAQAWIDRTTNSEMRGGVVFDSDGIASVFMSNDTSIDGTISASTVYSLLSSSDTYNMTLKTTTNSGSSSTSSNVGKVSEPTNFIAGLVALMSFVI